MSKVEEMPNASEVSQLVDRLSQPKSVKPKATTSQEPVSRKPSGNTIKTHKDEKKADQSKCPNLLMAEPSHPQVLLGDSDNYSTPFVVLTQNDISESFESVSFDFH